MLQKEALLAALDESELFDKSLVHQLLGGESKKPVLHQSIDGMLNINPSEVKEDVFQPLQIDENDFQTKSHKNGYLQLLQHEIKHLREKFELNNRTYQIEDLMRLTDNSKNILELKGLQKYIECDKKMGESVYYHLECLRMSLERKTGFFSFSQAYEKMIKIINNELNSNLKNSLENQLDPKQNYVIEKIHVAGDNDDLIINTWKSIINILGDKQEYLPDIWELAMFENIYYHL